MIISLIKKVKVQWVRRNSKSYILYLRSKGVSIGKNSHFFGNIRFVNIDITRPSLVKIGDNVKIVSPFALLTHGFEWAVFREKYNEIVGSSGRVTIGNNVYIGRDAFILKGTKIGDNVIIGARSLVTKDIPSNCVAVGIPARKIIDLDVYFKRRKKEYINEAKEYAYSIYESLGSIPREEDFFEFFPLFLNRDMNSIADLNVRMKIKMKKEDRRICTVQSQLGSAFDNFLNSHPCYESFEAFLRDAGIPLK